MKIENDQLNKNKEYYKFKNEQRLINKIEWFNNTVILILQ